MRIMSIKNIDNYKIKVLYTDCMRKNEINDFIYVQNQVFSERHTQNKFQTKYLENPFGNSLIVLVYDEEECIAARSFWRNDLLKDDIFVESYQPCDSAVIEKHRGKSLHKIMTHKALEEVGDFTYFYSFPNDSSLPTYKKLDWKLITHLKYSLFNYKRDNHIIPDIDKNYINWLFNSESKNDKLSYTKIHGKYYLLRRRNKYLYVVIGKVSSSIKNQFNKAILPICLVYREGGKIGRGLTIVGKNIDGNMSIPIHKMDTLF